MLLPFGDWSDDGHGKYKTILIRAPSMECLLNAQLKIKEKYGNDFFHGMAEHYEEPYFSETVWQALIDTHYPIERFIRIEDTNEWDGMNSLKEVLEADPNPCLGLSFVIDAFIWLLNAHDAQIEHEPDETPMICNWTCTGFETVGYGCFW